MSSNEQKKHSLTEDLEPTLDIAGGMTDEEAARLEAEKVLEKYDKESSYRNQLTPSLNIFIAIVLVAFSLFQLYTTI